MTMNNFNKIDNEADISSRWGLLCNVKSSFGARLVQERHRLHFLPDRSELVGEWSEQDISALNSVFPKIIKDLEVALLVGELDSRHQKRIRIAQGGFVCEADSLGSFGYIYICIFAESEDGESGHR